MRWITLILFGASLFSSANAQIGLPGGIGQLMPRRTVAPTAAACTPIIINASKAVVISATVNVC